jgi:DNA-binding transcriptional ArsR family regulator
MSFDPLIANPGRLAILTALAAEQPRDFVRLRESTRLTDGNLSSHARRLADAGLVRIDKAIRAGKPVTTFVLTSEGKRRLAEHVGALMTAVGVTAPSGEARSATTPRDTFDGADDWVD